jgi:branched-chain amino acid aminotransferase
MSNKDVSTFRIAPRIWKNGEFIDWNDARVHVMTHAIHYGSSVFEGIRAYRNENGTAVFRLEEHMQRLINSAHIYRMDPVFTKDDFVKAAVDLVRDSGLPACYLRPIIFRGLDEAKPTFGVNPFPNPLECYIAAWEWGRYLGEEALKSGVDVCVSSWTRIPTNSMPAAAKAGANYMNSQLVKMEAIVNGYHEGIALDQNGQISEGSGENIFAVFGDTLVTPPLGASILPGITRDSVIKIGRDLGIEVREMAIQRGMIYTADEVFFCGTAAEITPIRSIDKIQVGAGRRGPVTERVQDAFFDVINGRRPAPGNAQWLTYVNS